MIRLLYTDAGYGNGVYTDNLQGEDYDMDSKDRINNTCGSRPLDLRNIKVTDPFWREKIELVRTEVIPYQWNALNDNVEGAAPSYCMHNFRAAVRKNHRRRELGAAYIEPKYVYKGFETLPEDPGNPDPDSFYGLVFQDTDFSKWIEAVAYSLTQHPDEDLEKVADGAIDIVCEAQADDGYLDTYYIVNGRDAQFTNLRDHHELYCFGHLVEGAVAYYQATGKNKLLNAAKRFADYVADNFGLEEGKLKGYPGHEIAEMALVRLYEVTGDDKYYKLAKYFIDERGQRPYYFDGEEHPEMKIKGHEDEERYTYYQSHKPVREMDEAVGHAVRAVYLYSGMADIARISGDRELYDACCRLWDNIVDKKMYITGGIGATHIGESFSFEYDLPNDTAYAETCASIGMAFFARRMLEISPNAKYADIIEREMYNGILSGMALDGKSFFYVNPLEVVPEACKRDERKSHVKPVRQKWFGCACCPPNLARFISSIGSYAYTENDSTLFVHQYIGGEITKSFKSDDADAENILKLSIDSEMPWAGRVSVKVEGKAKGCSLAFRIPGWCEGVYKLTGFDGDVREENGYIYLTKDWDRETSFGIEFDMQTQIVKADYRVRENRGKAAVMRGPIVYCLEEADNGDKLHMCMLDANAQLTVSDIEIEGIRANMITAKGKRCIAPDVDVLYSGREKLYTHCMADNITDVSLRYIPYYMWANRGENEMQVWTDLY